MVSREELDAALLDAGIPRDAVIDLAGLAEGRSIEIDGQVLDTANTGCPGVVLKRLSGGRCLKLTLAPPKLYVCPDCD